MFAATTGGLGAILINPPTTSGGRTRRHLEAAGTALGHPYVAIANLCTLPSRDVNDLSRFAADRTLWHAARPELKRVIEQSDALIAAWGVKAWSGPSAVHLRDQLAFVQRVAIEAGKNEIWTLHGEPRHPSRWHQYVSDRHGRATGGSLAVRLADVLEAVPLDAVVSSGANARTVPSAP